MEFCQCGFLVTPIGHSNQVKPAHPKTTTAYEVKSTAPIQYAWRYVYTTTCIKMGNFCILVTTLSKQSPFSQICETVTELLYARQASSWQFHSVCPPLLFWLASTHACSTTDATVFTDLHFSHLGECDESIALKNVYIWASAEDWSIVVTWFTTEAGWSHAKCGTLKLDSCLQSNHIFKSSTNSGRMWFVDALIFVAEWISVLIESLKSMIICHDLLA